MKNIRSNTGSKTIAILVGYALAIMATWACEEEEEPVDRDPSVSIFFLNKDSLDKVSFIADSLEEELIGFDTVIANLNEDASFLANRLIDITDSIDNGASLEDEKAQVEHDLDTLENYLIGVELEDSTVNATYNEWLDVASMINSGYVNVTSIKNLKNGDSVIYDFSSSSWNLPLDMNADDVDVNITIDDQTYRLVLKYNRFTVVDEFNAVVIRTSGFEIVQTDFDSSAVSCIKCIDTQTFLHVEF